MADRFNEERDGDRCPKKLREWSSEAMESAMKAAREGEMGVNRAALVEHNVSKTALKDQLSRRVEHGKPIGRALFLTSEEEKELYEFLVENVRLGNPKTRVEAIDMYARC